MTRLPRLKLSPKASLGTLCATALLAACGGGDVDTPDATPAAGLDAPTMQALSASGTVVQRDIVVMLRTGVASATFARSYGVTVVDQFGKRPIYRLRAAKATAVPGLIQRMRADPRVQFAETGKLLKSP